MSAVEELKKQGNAAFSAHEYKRAVDLYTEAIEMDEENFTLYSNRSGAYCGWGRYKQAEMDARKVIQIKPDWVRGHTRLGAALEGQKKWDEAAQAYEEALKLDPENQNIQSDLQHVRSEAQADEKESDGLRSFLNPQSLAMLRMNPKTAGFFSDPAFASAMNDIVANPKNMEKYMNDPRMQTVFQVLLEPLMARAGANAGAAAEERDEENNSENQASHAAAEERPAPKPAAEAPKPQPTSSPAETEKNLGNDAFKAGNLDEALVHYDKAIELEPTNIVYYNNKATVLTKQKKFDEAIELLNKAIETGRANHASYDNIAKAYTKIASAEVGRDNYDAAIEALKLSQLEKADPTVKRELKRLQDINTKRKAAAYENPELAEKARKEGNELFGQKKFPEAINAYTEAIKRAPRNPALYSNRAAAYCKLMELPMALKDCDKAIEIDPNFAKAYTRKGFCHYKMKEYHRAQEAYNMALKIDPNNAEAVDGLQSIQREIAEQRYKGVDEEQVRHAMADPEIQAILQDPGMRQILQDIQTNPSAAQAHLADPKVRDALMKLQAAGILRMG